MSNVLTTAEAKALVEAWDLETDLEDIVEHSDPVFVSAVKKLLETAGIDASDVGEPDDKAEDDEGVDPE